MEISILEEELLNEKEYLRKKIINYGMDSITKIVN
jgi:hypothetical protein